MVYNKKFFLDLYCRQNNHYEEIICGDVFLFKRIKEEERTVIVLSDGMGHGIKANILATLTASMALNFTIEHRKVERAAETIMNTLPVCSVRKISYSTFTIIDMDDDGNTTIIEYDNPDCLIIRSNKDFNPGWENIVLQSGENKGKIIRKCSFTAEKNDRIVFWTDGIVQAGMGTTDYPFGWERKNAVDYALNIVSRTPDIPAVTLATKIVNKALQIDNGLPKDDTSCGVIYLREPRKLILVSGPPFDKEKDKIFAEKVKNFQGRKVIAGGSTANVLIRELNLNVKPGMTITDEELPPVSHVEGFDLVTEGILTLNKTAKILEDYKPGDKIGLGPADKLVKLLLDSDTIYILNGTGVNIAHQDPNLPDELGLRRTVIKRIANLLENKFLKEISIEYI